LHSGARQRRRSTRLHPAEILTILILFQQSGYRTFKGFYTQHVQVHLHQEFPRLLSYIRFVALMPRYLVPLAIYLHTQLGECSGISFIDSTSLAVCHPARIWQHRVFAVDARRGRTSVGWFYGLKLRLVVNDRGELLALCLTPGATDDRRPVPRLVRWLFGRLFGDKGYISAPLAERLLVTQELRLITKLRKNMRQQLLEFSESSPTDCCCASGRSSRRSWTSSKTSARLSTPATAAPTTSSSTCSPVSPPIAASPRSPRWTLPPTRSSLALSKTDVRA
jgi:hypothetical protein